MPSRAMHAPQPRAAQSSSKHLEEDLAALQRRNRRLGGGASQAARQQLLQMCEAVRKYIVIAGGRAAEGEAQALRQGGFGCRKGKEQA